LFRGNEEVLDGYGKEGDDDVGRRYVGNPDFGNAALIALTYPIIPSLGELDESKGDRVEVLDSTVTANLFVEAKKGNDLADVDELREPRGIHPHGIMGGGDPGELGVSDPAQGRTHSWWVKGRANESGGKRKR
jgi:hypothetical protein